MPQLLENAAEQPCSYIPYSPLSAGVLSGKYATRAKTPKRSRLTIFKGYQESFKATQARLWLTICLMNHQLLR